MNYRQTTILTICFWLLAIFSAQSHAAALVQGSCVDNDIALRWLSFVLSADSLISCLGQPGQKYNANRYWGSQFSKNASVVVFPATSQDVSFTIIASSFTPIGYDVAFASGAHSMTNDSSSCDMVIDLSYMNETKVHPSFESPDGSIIPVIEYRGGANWEQVINATTGSGLTAVGARDSKVGVGGFSTGGGIGFLAGAYGYATDRLVALEVVLPTGKIVNATKKNKYSDLFWSFQGGNGLAGIVTTFYAQAVPEPTEISIGVYYIAENETEQARENTVNFFKSNNDPYAVVYYATGFVPPNLSTTDPATFGTRTFFAAWRFNNPTLSDQPSYNTTFEPLLRKLHPPVHQVFSLPYQNGFSLIDPFFPYGFRRGFYGPQTTEITVGYLANISDTMTSYLNDIQAAGEDPVTATFIVQYMYPGLNGHLPKDDADTAWPHSTSGHQTLFSPAWLKASNDGITARYTAKFNQITYDHQAKVGPFLANYPNYVSPGDPGWRVFGSNTGRLAQVKQKYDPFCRFHQGRVIASEACVAGGWANVFP